MTDLDYATVLQKIKEEKVNFIEFWFTDIFGELHSLGIPAYSITEDYLKNGLHKIDSSSIRGFGSVNESDISLVPDIDTFKILPPDYDAGRRKNARMFVDLFEQSSNKQGSKSRYDRDSRGICIKALSELEKFGLSNAFWGPEVEFFVFDKIDSNSSGIGTVHSFGSAGYTIESEESHFKSDDLFFNMRPKSGYYKAQPTDTLNDLRKDICDDLYKYFEIKIEAQHHEVATVGQCEINIEYGDSITTADNVVTIKNLSKVKAKRMGKVATFMPKPFYGDNASAMHIHQSLWTADGHNAMYDPNNNTGEISQLARYYIGGILDHAEALCAISNPTTNSYKRLIPGYEAPIYACWGVSNRSTAIRIPLSERNNEKLKRIEYRVPDSATNIYLLETSLLMAGLDGIRNKIEPGDPIEENVYHLSPEQKRKFKIKPLPTDLKSALDALKCDNKFLQNVFSKGFLDTYISLKSLEYDEFAQMPTSWEILTYSNV